MAYSPTYRPSLLELAQGGNCRALTYWMNSFLAPQGISVQVHPASGDFLKVLISFRYSKHPETYRRLRDRLTRLICYRLWTLNSDAIQGVRLVARIAGDSRVLWQTSVRINSPAVAKLRQTDRQSRHQPASQLLTFRVLRALFMSSITLAGFFIGYWLFYVEMGRLLVKSRSSEAMALTDTDSPDTDSPDTDSTEQGPADSTQAEATPQIPAPPGQANFAIPERSQGQVISRIEVPETEKVVALTFDGGPHPEATAQVLEILKQYKAQATFFMTGANIEEFPEMAQRVVNEGHAVGNRGWHQNLETGNFDPEREVDDTTELIEQTTGAKTELFRPPDGRLDDKLISYVKERQYAVTLWSVDAQDTLVAAPILLDNVLRSVRSGRIVLMHDTPGKTTPSALVQALPQILTALQQQGYRFITIPQLLEMQSPHEKDTKAPLHRQVVATGSDPAQVGAS